jgi:hypothetical protein
MSCPCPTVLPWLPKGRPACHEGGQKAGVGTRRGAAQRALCPSGAVPLPVPRAGHVQAGHRGQGALLHVLCRLARQRLRVSGWLAWAAVAEPDMWQQCACIMAGGCAMMNTSLVEDMCSAI